MPTIGAKVEMEDTLRALKQIAGDQWPFAMAKSLTDLAKRGRDGAQVRTRRAFDLKTEFIPRGITIKSAKKSDVKLRGTADAAVLTKPLVSEFMPIHEFSGVKTPGPYTGAHDSGKMLAIPGRDLRGRKYLTGRGKVRKRWAPAELLKQYNAMSPREAARTRGGRERAGARVPFVTQIGSGTPAIVRRKSKRKRLPLEVLWVFVPESRIPKHWRMEETVQRIVKGTYQMVFKRNVEQALATRRA
jgi:hypothetical protein